MEVVLALSIILVVALSSAPHHVRKAPSMPAPPTTGAGRWNARALPIITSLVDDLRAIDSHTSQPTQAEPGWLGTDDARLRTDAAAAQRLQAPPNPGMRTAWTVTLDHLWRAERTLGAAVTSLDPATVALAHQQFAVAGAGLLRIGQAISPQPRPDLTVTGR